ncbi:MAG TPA: lipoyl(octanoyl) transferase LipB [Capsulimonadaceae bacterium]
MPTPIPYDEAYALQLAVHGQRARNEVVDTLLLLEHPAVITVGRGSKGRGDLLTSPEELNRKGIAYVETDRGGEMTYHAPGQLVGYAIMDLSARGRDLHVFLRDLEQTIIDTLAEFDVTGSRKPGLTGVWVGEQKICAMGIKVSRWVSMHGFALNIAPNMAPFREDLIPCGIRDKGVVSLAELGRSVNRSTIEMAYLRSFANVFNVDIAAANVSATTI